MIRPVLGTIAAKVLISSMNLLLVIAAGQALGVEGLGSISLVVLGITIILVMNHVIGGGGLVYLLPRHGMRALIGPSYLWALVTMVVAFGAGQFVPFAPDELLVHVVLLAFLQSLSSIHLNILLGRERIAIHNGILVGQSMVQAGGFVVLLFLDGSSVMDYVGATYAAHVTTALVSARYAYADLPSKQVDPKTSIWSALFRQGGLAQGANLLQLLNYRLGYYLIDHFRGLGALGIFSISTQLAETAWLIPKSIGGVLYTKLSNLDEAERQRQLTLVLFKVAVLVGTLASIALLVIPESIYSWVFGKEVQGLHPILLGITPGLIAMSGSQVLSHFLSGTGRVWVNTAGSGIGLVITLAAGWFLIGRYGAAGAAITASMAYCASVTYQLYHFQRITGSKLVDLLPHAGDRKKAMGVIQRMRSR